MTDIRVNSVRPDAAAGKCNMSFKAGDVLVQLIGLPYSDGQSRSESVKAGKAILTEILEADPG